VIDTHVHLLPGLDDGPATLDESLALARLLVQDGVRKAVATVHNYEHVYEATPGVIRDATRRLQAAMDAEGLPLEILPAMEIQLREGIADRIRRGELMTVADRGAFALLELPFQGIAMDLGEVLFHVQVAGIRCILAHPERNAQVREDPSILRDLCERGCRVQLNADSLLVADRGMLRTARTMLKSGIVTFLGSDAHSAVDRPPMLSAAVRAAGRVIGRENALALVTKNPEAMLASTPF
jgi:protein-tyrosine phosphatase